MLIQKQFSGAEFDPKTEEKRRRKKLSSKRNVLSDFLI